MRPGDAEDVRDRRGGGSAHEEQIRFWRGAVFVLPVLAFLLTRRLCVELGDSRRRAPPALGADRL